MDKLRELLIPLLRNSFGVKHGSMKEAAVDYVKAFHSKEWAAIYNLLAEEEAQAAQVTVKAAPSLIVQTYEGTPKVFQNLPTEQQAHLGLRSTRFINQPEWNSDYD